MNLNHQTLTENMPGPDTIQRFELPNHITLLTMTNSNTPSIYMVGILETASKYDPSDKLGLADFTASMLSRGTKNRDFHQIHDLLESTGASLSFSASTQNTWFSGRSLSEDLPLLLEIATDCLTQPSFPQEYIERMRAQILTSLAIRDQDTGEMASMRFDQILFPDHPYGQPTDGYPKTIKTITREDLLNFHSSFFYPAGMILVVVGDIQPSKILELVRNTLGSWVNPTKAELPSLPIIKPVYNLAREHVEIPEKSQTDILMGCLGPARVAADYLPIHLGNDILGQFGMMGRIGESVRIQAGLAYYAASNVNSWKDAGVWEFSAGVNPSNTEKTIDLIRKEIDKYLQKPVEPTELADSKSHLTGRLVLSMESNAGLANAIMSMEHFQSGLDYFQRYPTLINAITAEDILSASRKYLNSDHLAIVSAGTSPRG